MKSLLHRILLVCCALSMSGTHWVVLQMTAWTGMIVARSHRAPVAEAVESTFSGQHPCRLCKAIDTAKKEQKQEDRGVSDFKKLQETKFVAVQQLGVPSRLGSDITWPEASDRRMVRREPPRIQPPRV